MKLNTDKRSKVGLIGFFLSRYGEEALKQLGFKTIDEAVNKLAEILDVSPKTIRIYKGKFDHITNMSNYCKRIMDATIDWTIEDFLSEITSFFGVDVRLHSINNEILNSFFDAIYKGLQEKTEKKDIRIKEEKPYEKENINHPLNEEWHIEGNIHDFINGLKVYKNSFHLLLPSLPDLDPINGTNNEPKENELFEESLGWWLIQRIENQDNYNEFILRSSDVLSIIDRIVPKESFISPTINSIRQNLPNQSVMSCIYYHSALMNLSELVHLHRKPTKYKTGLMLMIKADNYLGLGTTHYIKVLSELMRLSQINWCSKGIREIMRLLYKNITYKPTATIALNALEVSIPLARRTYNLIASTKTQLEFYQTTTLSNGYVINDGQFALPFGLKGYFAYYPDVRRVLIGFRGTNNVMNFITDLVQYIVGVSVVYKMALGLLLELKDIWKKQKFFVVGHSLGGGLTQFAVAGINNPDFIGFGYNSAGLSNIAKDILKDRIDDNVFHLHLKRDQVFLIGNQLGQYINQTAIVNNFLVAHKLDVMWQKKQYFVGFVGKFLDSIPISRT